jgi:hypothetical protein
MPDDLDAREGDGLDDTPPLGAGPSLAGERPHEADDIDAGSRVCSVGRARSRGDAMGVGCRRGPPGVRVIQSGEASRAIELRRISIGAERAIGWCFGRSSPTIARVTERRRIPSPPASTTAHVLAAWLSTAHPRTRHRQPGYGDRGGGTPIAEEVDHPIDPARPIESEHQHPARSAPSTPQLDRSLHRVRPPPLVTSTTEVISPAARASAVPQQRRPGRRRLTAGGWRFRALRSAIPHGVERNRTGNDGTTVRASQGPPGG